MHPRYLFPILLCFATAFGAFAQSTNVTTLERTFAVAITDSARYDALMDLYKATFKTDPQQSKNYVEQMLALYIHTDDWRRICKAYMSLARCERKKRAYPAVFILDAKVLEYANKSGSISLRFTANKTFANDYLDAEQYSRVMPYLHEAEQVAAKESSPAYMSDVYYTYAVLYLQQAQNKKSLPYFRKAINAFRQTGNDKSRANAQEFMVEAMLALGIRDSTDYLLEDAMETLQKTGSTYAIAEAYGRLGRIFLTMGDRERALDYYGKARERFHTDHNETEYALTGLDIAAEKMNAGDMAGARQLIGEAGPIFLSANYKPGIAHAKIIWADYHSRVGNRLRAAREFREAMQLAAAPDAAELRIKLRRLHAAHYIRYKDYRAADTLIYKNAEAIVKAHDPEQTTAELAFLRKRSKSLDSTTHTLLSLLYKPGGSKKLQALLGGRSFTETLAERNMAQVIYSAPATDAVSDSIREAEYHDRYLAMETKFRTRVMRDSLNNETRRLENVLRQRELSNQLLAAVCIICLLLAAGFGLQRRYRMRAEHDAAEISGLSKRVRHLTDNNLAMIYSYIDEAMADDPANSNSIARSLKSRIAALILLNKRLYTSDPAEEVILQDYLAELADMAKTIFDPEGRVTITVNALPAVNRDTAARLGIITAELLTNSYKYAFKGKSGGHISLDIEPLAGGMLRMHYHDNGPGLPEVTTYGEGMGHIIGDSHSLRGNHQFYNECGLHFTLEFRPSAPKKISE